MADNGINVELLTAIASLGLHDCCISNSGRRDSFCAKWGGCKRDATKAALDAVIREGVGGMDAVEIRAKAVRTRGVLDPKDYPGPKPRRLDMGRDAIPGLSAFGLPAPIWIQVPRAWKQEIVAESREAGEVPTAEALGRWLLFGLPVEWVEGDEVAALRN